MRPFILVLGTDYPPAPEKSSTLFDPLPKPSFQDSSVSPWPTASATLAVMAVAEAVLASAAEAAKKKPPP